MITQTEQRQKQTYTVRNDDIEARSVVIEHPVRPGWTVGGSVKPTETTTAWYRYRVPVAAKTTATFDVEETRPSQTQVQITNVTDPQIALLVRDQALTPPMEAALREILTRKAAIATLVADAAARQRDIDEIGRDQTRVRENLQALKGSSEEKQLVQRYVKQLDEQETRLQALRKELQDLQANRARAEAELARYIESLAFG
jgi:septal ring factor EnvC (AmiA/AmiB activator)